MLVLTRKLDEQILIGDDIKITLLRVRGNTVRIGIEAPRDLRIVRAELDVPKSVEVDSSSTGTHATSTTRAGAPAAHEQPRSAEVNRMSPATTPQVFVGTVKRSGKDVRLTRAPLAGFVSAS